MPCAMAQPDVSVARNQGAEPFGAGTLPMFVRPMRDSTSGAEVVTGGNLHGPSCDNTNETLERFPQQKVDNIKS